MVTPISDDQFDAVLPLPRSMTRQEALEKGLKRYFTGKPCTKGHIAERTLPKNICVECQRIYANDWQKRKRKENPSFQQKERLAGFNRKHGLNFTDAQYQKLLKKQNGCCAICKIPQDALSRSFHIDHDHKTDKIRGLLCGSCNRALGYFKDNALIVADAFLYLARSSR